MILTAIAMAVAITGAQAREPGWHTMTRDEVGCISLEKYSSLVDMRLSGDKEAYKKAAMAAFLAGQCVILKKGDEVYMVDIKMFSGIARVRKRGDTREIWIDYGFMD